MPPTRGRGRAGTAVLHHLRVRAGVEAVWHLSVTEKKTITEMPNLVDFFAEMACVRLVLRHRVVACEGVLMRRVGCYGETAAC
jgi:hypothetical protein